MPSIQDWEKQIEENVRKAEEAEKAAKEQAEKEKTEKKD